MPRFVILRHETPTTCDRPSHWDLLLEDGSMLISWALSSMPSDGLPIEGRALPPHRLRYLDYEGPLSQGRGTVQRWDHGTFQWLRREETYILLQLSGRKLIGTAKLTRVDSAPLAGEVDETPQRWQFVFWTT